LETVLLAQIYDPLGQGGSLERLEFTYDLTDAWDATAGLVLYQSGDKPGFEDLNKCNRLFFKMHYKFQGHREEPCRFAKAWSKICNEKKHNLSTKGNGYMVYWPRPFHAEKANPPLYRLHRYRAKAQFSSALYSR
jgi:hypothetical protein